MKTADFSQPRRMSTSAFAIFFVKTLRKWSNHFLLLLVYVHFKWSKTLPWYTLTLRMLAVVGCVVIAAGAMAFVSFYFKRYYVENGNLIFMHGVLKKQTTSMPLHKIQSTRTRQGLIYRLLDMKGVTFDTLASQSEEVEMILDEADWQAMLCQIETGENKAICTQPSIKEETCAEEALRTPASDAAPKAASTAETRLTFKNLNLIKGAFCQNHLRGFVLLVWALIMVIDQLSSVDEEVVTGAFDYADAHIHLWTWPMFLLAIAGTYLGILLLWMSKVFLRYFDMDLRIDGQQLFFESGLLSRNSCRFTHNKICTIYVKQNFLEKALHCNTLMLHQALNATDEHQGADVKIYGSDVAPQLLNWWLGTNYASSAPVAEAQSGKGVIGYMLRLPLLLCVVLGIVLCHFELYYWLALPAFYLLLTVGRGFLAAHRSRIVLKEDYVEVHSGQLAAERHYFKYEHIEVVRLVASPFTPVSHRVCLQLSTNGTDYMIRSLKEHEARYIYEQLLLKGYLHGA